MIDNLDLKNDSLIMLSNQVNLLTNKMDSITQVNRDLMVNKNYFSDIIATQMDWFALIFVITFGILGLAYWIGIFKYFRKKFDEHEKNLKETRNSLLSKIVQKDKESRNTILSNYTILDNKISSLEKCQTDLNKQKFTTISDDINKLQNTVSELIGKTENEIKDIIEKQNNTYNKERDNILSKLWDTNFNTQRSMFFSCYRDKAFSSALTWLIPMIEMIVNKEVDYELKDFVKLATECITSMKIDNTIKERFDEFNDTLVDLEKKLEDNDNKELIKQLKIHLNRTFYNKESVEKSSV
jgi:hypothetical protein